MAVWLADFTWRLARPLSAGRNKFDGEAASPAPILRPDEINLSGEVASRFEPAERVPF